MTRTAPFRGGKSIQESKADEAEQVPRSSLAISREIEVESRAVTSVSRQLTAEWKKS